MRSLILSLCITVILSACSDPPARLGHPVTPHEEEKFLLAPSQIAHNPHIKLTFIMDPSSSMKGAIENLNEGLPQFANSLTNKMVNNERKDSNIDISIASTTVWDTKIFEDEDRKLPSLPDLGELIVPSGLTHLSPFITRSNPNFLDVLKNTLKIRIAPYSSEGPSGPETEELLTPIAKLIQDDSKYKDFYAPAPNTLHAFIIVTDADIDSPEDQKISAQLAEKLKAKYGSHVLLYAIISPGSESKLFNPEDRCYYKDNPGRHAPFDYGRRYIFKDGVYTNQVRNQVEADPYRLLNFVGLIPDSRALSFCDKNFGHSLAQVGEELRQHLTQDYEIILKYVPEKSSIKVTYGKPDDKNPQIVPNHDEYGWTYDPRVPAVYINSDPDVEFIPDGVFKVQTRSVRDMRLIKQASVEESTYE